MHTWCSQREVAVYLMIYNWCLDFRHLSTWSGGFLNFAGLLASVARIWENYDGHKHSVIVHGKMRESIGIDSAVCFNWQWQSVNSAAIEPYRLHYCWMFMAIIILSDPKATEASRPAKLSRLSESIKSSRLPKSSRSLRWWTIDQLTNWSV